MRILHICSYYIGNKLYKNLIRELSFESINQDVFIPIKVANKKGLNQLSPEFSNVTYHYKNILKKYDKFLYHNKIKKQMQEIESSILTNRNIDFIHAHTLFSDGGTAYKLYKKYGINYIVNIRNTDINIFYKYGLHLRPFMFEILLNAKNIIFISHAYKQELFSLLPSNILYQIKNKCHVIPNGIEDYWHANTPSVKSKSNSHEIKLLFIGTVDSNKNLRAVIISCAELLKEGYNISLDIIGEGPLEGKYKNLCKKLSIDDNVIFHGFVNQNDTIIKIMDQCDILVMPSFKETFGIVYIEAMSRGLPVIYSKGQGIDGFFTEGEIGFHVDPNKSNLIVESIRNIYMDYLNMSERCIEYAKDFKWSTIANQYLGIYRK